jgi:aminopyrrolnitrin oxygenase
MTLTAAKTTDDDGARGRIERPLAQEVLALRTYPRSWYLVCQSRDVARGAVVSRELLGHAIVLFRTQEGEIHALSAHCPHMGTHLGGGTVVDDCLRCPMHHWAFDGSGQCRTQPAAQRAWPVAERFGSVFVFFGDEPLFGLPVFDAAAESELCTGAGRPVEISCPWVAIAANGFDAQHLSAVHQRALREPPDLESIDRHRLRLRYVSRVTGKGLVDRVTKWLSQDHVRVSITCWGGTLFTVESRLGKVQSMLLLGIRPTAGGRVEVTPVVAMKRARIGLWDGIRVRLSLWLFTCFLKKDLAILQEMRFQAPGPFLPTDEPLRLFLEYLDGLPAAPGGF